MWLTDSEKKLIFNLDNVVEIFVGRESTVVCRSTESEKQPLESYASDAEANYAVYMVASRLSTSSANVISTPTEDEVRQAMQHQAINKGTIHHYADGAKTKGHGAS